MYGLDLELTRTEFGLGFQSEYNRSFHYSWDGSAFGLLEVNEALTVTGGISAGQIWDTPEINAYASAEFIFPFFRRYVPLGIKAGYIYNGLPGYETHSHTLLPLLLLHWKWFGFSAGMALRFTSFAGESALFEYVPAYSVDVNFFNMENAAAGIGVANFNTFEVRNLGSYVFRLYNRFRIGPHISVTGELEVVISGNVARLTSVYGIAYRKGLVFTW
jgi:hypothetical protein